MTENDLKPSLSDDAHHKAARQQGSAGSSGVGSKGANNEAPQSTSTHVASQGDRALFSDAAPLVTPSQEPFSGSQLEQLSFAASQLPPVMLSQGDQLPGPSQDLLGNATQGSQSIEELMAKHAAAAAATALKGEAVAAAAASDATAGCQRPEHTVAVSLTETGTIAQLFNNPTQMQALQELVKGAGSSCINGNALSTALAALAASGAVIPTPQAPSSGGQQQQQQHTQHMLSSFVASPAATAGVAAAASTTTAIAADMDALQQQQQQQQLAAQYPQYLPAVAGMHQHYAMAPQPRHASVAKPEHAGSMAKRRGPMDEMRQLQRILTKLLPASAGFMPSGVDGGGNKVQAEQIKIYLAATLGEAPKPDWGLRNGWGQYLADLFNWATGRSDITNYMAMDTARRQQGRSWEVLHDKLMELGVYSWNWELPLRLEQVRNCANGPPPELQRQQAALAAATAAAAASAGGVHAGQARRSSGSVAAAASPAVSAAAMQQQLLAAYPNTGAGMLPAVVPSVPPAVAAAPAAATPVAAALPAAGAADPPADPPAAYAAAALVAQKAPAELDQAVKARRIARPSSSNGVAAIAAIPAATVDASAAAALAAAAVSSSAHFKLPSQEELNGGTCLQLLEFISRCLTKATQAVQNKAASSGTEPHHNQAAVVDRLKSVTAQLHKFTTLMTNVSAMYAQRALAELATQQQLHQQQMILKAQAAATPLPSAADTTSTAAAAVAVGTTGAGTSATAAAGGCSSLAASHPQLQQQVQQPGMTAEHFEQVQQIAQYFVSSQSQPGCSRPTLLQALLQQSQQQQQQPGLPALAVVISQDVDNASQAQDWAAAAAAPVAAADAANQPPPAPPQELQPQQQVDPAAAAAAAGQAAAGSGGLHDEDAGEEMALDVSLAGVHPAALGPTHTAAYATAAVTASGMSAAGAPAAAGVGEDRAWLAAISAPVSKPASSKVSAARNGSFAQAAVAARAYAARGGGHPRSKQAQHQHLQERVDEAMPCEASVTGAAGPAEHHGEEELNAEDAAELLLGIRGSQGTGIGPPLGSPSSNNSSKRQVSSGRGGVGSLLGSKRKAEDEGDYAPPGH